MIQRIHQLPAAAIASFALQLILAATQPAAAQSLGYATSNYGIQPFNPTSATLLGWIHVSEDIEGVPAVSSDGSKLYLPFENNGSAGTVLGVLSPSGALISRITGMGYSETYYRDKVLLSPNGETAFVMCNDSNTGPSLIAIVNLNTEAVTGYFLAQDGYFFDIALSPDGGHLFASVASYSDAARPAREADPQASTPLYGCPGANTICDFNTSTFALAHQVKSLSGSLYISQDGKSLYVILGTATFALDVLNTTSFARSSIALPFFPLVMAIAPSGNQAVVAASTDVSALDELLLDTQSNTVVGTVPAPPIPKGTGIGQGGSTMAFSPDGASLWTLLCSGLSCNQMIVGQSFPSGNLIGEATLPLVEGFNSIVF
jgi:DNA-binding beta-propeller fold protein YncE